MNSDDLFPRELLRIGPFSVTDTLVTSVVVSVALLIASALLMRSPRARETLSLVYETLERSIVEMASVDVRPLVPLILTLWLFIAVANLVGLIPGVGSPTRDLSVTTALALIAFFSGHYYAFAAHGPAYLRSYLEPHVMLLPFNIIGELSRTVALSLRLFGNMLSGQLIAAILVYLMGLLLPVPLLLLSVLTSVVQAYIFGVLTLVFAASSMETTRAITRRASASKESTP